MSTKIVVKMEDFDWNVQQECSLLESMLGHKPIGVSKYFQMASIYDKFSSKCEKEIRSAVVWAHLEKLYNLEALDENEAMPFPNAELDFELPDSEFGDLKETKVEEKKNVQKGCETPKSGKEVKRDKTPYQNIKEIQQRRDSKDSRSSSSSRKETKRENDKSNKLNKNRSTSSMKEEAPKGGKTKNEDVPRSSKRPTRGSLKPEDNSNSGKSSPVTVSNSATIKRRRI
ncbi:hypothetical protein FQA39_LY18122 [Lamprigera yunnana]|nr:hypothetical protein FQA39_LY18122 [Lamprigera yunnana]